MRVLIIGEFSSFAKNLSNGLRDLGHECFVFSWGDGFKNIKQEEQYSCQISPVCFHKEDGLFSAIIVMLWNFTKFLKLKSYVRKMSKKEKWDSVLVVNPGFIQAPYHFWQPLFTESMIKSLVRNENNIYLSACGGDFPYFEYWSHHRWKNADIVNEHKAKFLSKLSMRHFENCTRYIKKVIPVMYGYAEAWRKSNYTRGITVIKTIPLPVECSEYVVNNIVGRKVVVFHGIIRPIDKGSSYIVEAMRRLQENYPEDVECKTDGGMPLGEYLEVLSRTNILVDQALADYTGMNGLYGLAMGKVVFSGNEPETKAEFGENNIPIINITPDADQIYNELVKFIGNKEKISAISKESRKYVERVHDAKVVARQYVEVFEQYNS